MKNINHLTFEPGRFLNVLKGADHETAVHYIDNENQQIWEGILEGDILIITCLSDPLEIDAVMKNYYPSMRRFDPPLTENDILWGEMMDEQNQREIEDFENEFGDDLGGVQG